MAGSQVMLMLMLIWHYAGADHNIDADIMLMLASEIDPHSGWITCDADYADGSQGWVMLMLMLISILCWCRLKKKLRDGSGKSEWPPAHLFRGWLCKVTLIIFQTYVFVNMFCICICICVLFLSFWAKLNWFAFRVWQLSTRGPLAEHWFSRPVSLVWSIYHLLHI